MIDTEHIVILYSPTVIECTTNALILEGDKSQEFYYVTCVKDKWINRINLILTITYKRNER